MARRHISYGTQEFCTKLQQFLVDNLTFAQVADFRAQPYSETRGAGTNMEHHDPTPDLWEVTADEDRCKQYSTSYLEVMKAAGDFRKGFVAAGGRSEPFSTREQELLRYAAEEAYGDEINLLIEARQMYSATGGFMTLAQCKKAVKQMQLDGEGWQLRGNWEPDSSWFAQRLSEQMFHPKIFTVKVNG